MALELVGAGGQAAAIGAAVSATICTVVAKYLLPKFLEAREKFEADMTLQFQTAMREREIALRDQATENRRLQSAIETGDTAQKFDLIARETVLRDMAHADVGRINVEIGKVAGRTEENARHIGDILERLDNMETKADVRHEEQGRTIHAMDKTVDRLAGAVENLATLVGKLKA